MEMTGYHKRPPSTLTRAYNRRKAAEGAALFWGALITMLDAGQYTELRAAMAAKLKGRLAAAEDAAVVINRLDQKTPQ